MKKTIFVLGAGNGCGNRVAEKFGKNDFRVILMARNEEHLAAYEAEFKEKGIEVYTKVADASKPYLVTKAFDELKSQFGTPDVLFYNVGITGLDSEMKVSKDFALLMERYRVDVAFLGAAAVGRDGYIYDGYAPEEGVKKSIIQSAARTYVLVDSSKFGHYGLITYSHVNGVEGVITDSGIDPEILKRLRDMGANVIIAE